MRRLEAFLRNAAKLRKKNGLLFIHVLPAFGIHDADDFKLALRIYPS